MHVDVVLGLVGPLSFAWASLRLGGLDMPEEEEEEEEDEDEEEEEEEEEERTRATESEAHRDRCREAV